MQTNTHHILYCRNTWDRGYAKRLRDHPYMQVKIPVKGLHEPIHKVLNCVPMPKPSRCVEAYKILKDLDNKGALKKDADIIVRLNILLCIWEGYPDLKPTCAALRVQLAMAEDYYKAHPRN